MSGEPLTSVLVEARTAALQLALVNASKLKADGQRLSVDEAATRFAVFLTTGSFARGDA